MELLVVLENTSTNRLVKGVHGFSLLIKTDRLQLLYDFGPRNHLVKNAGILGIGLDAVDLAVLSHNHMDHGGDINNFLAKNQKACVHAQSDLSEKPYAELFFGIKIPVGSTVDKKYMDRLITHKKTEEIAPGVHFVILSEYSNPSTINRNLLIRNNGTYSHDPFQHESALVIAENDGITVFCSCSHHGVVQILNDVKRQFPGNRIKAFVGGFHMYDPVSKKNELVPRIEETAERLSELDITVYTGHCTGDLALEMFTKKLGNRIVKLSTGMKFTIG